MARQRIAKLEAWTHADELKEYSGPELHRLAEAGAAFLNAINQERSKRARAAVGRDPEAEDGNDAEITRELR